MRSALSAVTEPSGPSATPEPHEPAGGGAGADADDDGPGGQDPAVREDDGPLLDAVDPGAGEELGAAVGVPGGHRGGHLGGQGARQRAGGGLDDGDGAARGAGGGGELRADPARPDDDHVVLPVQDGPQPGGVVEGAQEVDAGHALGAGQGHGLRAGREDQDVVGHRPVGGVQHMVGGAQGGDVQAEAQGDVECLEVDVEGGVLGLAQQDGLGQRRAVVGLVGFGADQGDGSGEARLAQGHGALHARHARSDDHDVPCLPRRPLFRLLAHPSTLIT